MATMRVMSTFDLKELELILLREIMRRRGIDSYKRKAGGATIDVSSRVPAIAVWADVET